MRSDMAKVIVERPRLKGWVPRKPKGVQRRLRRIGLDAVRREGIKRPYTQTKALNEHLGPLNRYLNSQVGRPWDKVFSEICAHVRRDSTVQDHVRDHVLDYVTVNVVLIDGVPCHAGGGGRFGRQLYGVPIGSGRLHQRFYVCPLSGLLKRVRRTESKRQFHARRKAPAPKTPSIPLDKTRQLHLIDGSWCEVSLRAFPPDAALSPARDVLCGNPLTPAQARERYGVLAYDVGVRRLDRDRLRSLPLPIDLLRRRRDLPEVVR